MSRDPLDDSSCLNYFCLLSNNPVISVDYLGMAHLKNMTSSMLLTLGNVPISDSCRRYLMEQIDNLFLGKNGLNGVLFLIGVGESSTHNSKISDIDGYWTTLSPGLPGHAEKIRRYHIIMDWDLSEKIGDTFSSLFLNNIPLTRWIDNTLKGRYLETILLGKEKCRCSDEDVENGNYAVSSSRQALQVFPYAK